MSTVLVEHALQLPPEQIGEALLDLPESQWFERKSGRVTAKKAAETVIAFANAEGGVLVIGVSNGVVDGVTPKLRNDLQQLALDHTEPAVPTRVDVLEAVHEGACHDVVVIRVAVGDHVVHTTKSDKVFLRVGDENREMSYLQRRELTFDRGQAAYERTPIGGELNTDLMTNYAQAVGASDPRRLLRGRGLILDDDRTTVGCLLLFGVHPQTELPHTHVRVVRHRGTTAETGTRQQLLADARIEGPIPIQLLEARRVIKEQLPVRQALGSDGRFGPVGIVPEDAWMEDSSTRSFTARTRSRATTSGSRCSTIASSSKARAASRASSTSQTHQRSPVSPGTRASHGYVLTSASARSSARESAACSRRCASQDLPIRNTTRPREVSASRCRASPVDRELDARLPARWRQAMQVIRDSGRASTGEVQEALDVSRPVTIKLLRAMQDAGLIDWVGKSEHDPRAYWQPRVE